MLVVSQNISKRLSTGSVSIIAKYCIPGVALLTIVISALKATVTGVATATGGVASFNLPTLILPGSLKSIDTLLAISTTLLRVTVEPFLLCTMVPSGIPVALTYWLGSILVLLATFITLLVLAVVEVVTATEELGVKPGVIIIVSLGKPPPLTLSPKAI